MEESTMRTNANVINGEFDINARIDNSVSILLTENEISLPGNNHDLIESYTRKIESTYNVARSKEDTDHAIELLYIAYNTTPQEEGNIRVTIDKLMTRLVSAQQQSELKMRGAVSDAERIIKAIASLFKDWRAVCKSNNSEDFKDFVRDDMAWLANEIKNRAEKINKDLTEIAVTYDGIIDDTTQTSNNSEQALAKRLKDKDVLEKEIVRQNAEREALEGLTKELKEQIDRFEKMANEYKSQAETAEQRAFVMSIVQVGAQMISSMVPSLASITGGSSLIGSAGNSTSQQLSNSQSATASDDDTAKAIETRKNIAEKKKEVTAAEREKADLEENAKLLSDEKNKIENNKSLAESDKKEKLEEIEIRITSNNQEIEKKDKAINVASAALNALNEAIKCLDDKMGAVIAKQEKQATGLRELQMSMLQKIDEYEKEKIKQNTNLVRINALLKGHRTEEETIQLAIQSLNLS